MNLISTEKIASKNIIILSDKIDSYTEILSKDDFQYFTTNWDQEELQYLRKHDGFVFVVPVKKFQAETIRKKAFEIFQILSKSNDALLVCDSEEWSMAFVEGFSLSGYQFLKYVTQKDKKKFQLETLYLKTPLTSSSIETWNNLLNSVFWVRDKVNEPVNHLDAEKLASEIVELGKKSGFSVEVLEKNKIESLKMGGLLAVNKGSETPPTFTIIEYKPDNALNKKPIVLVGKGVVYDTGGLSLKPSNYMETMKSDMAGAACMVGTINAVSLNHLPLHIIGLIPATDNRPGKNAFAPDDIITMYDGTNVEILNTDAEGRMILADALAFANKYEPLLVIDAATLTGSAVRALGTKTAVSMGNAKDTYFKQLYDAGMETNDKVFRFPFWDDWKDEIKSDIADLKNLGGVNAGMITAGKFLEHFVKYPYIHLDIAGTAFLETPDSYRGKGATGAGVRLLYQFLKNLKIK